MALTTAADEAAKHEVDLMDPAWVHEATIEDLRDLFPLGE